MTHQTFGPLNNNTLKKDLNVVKINVGAVLCVKLLNTL